MRSIFVVFMFVAVSALLTACAGSTDPVRGAWPDTSADGGLNATGAPGSAWNGSYAGGAAGTGH